MAGSTLVDAGFLVALLSRRDSHRDWAVAQARRFPPPWKTCEAALSDTAKRFRLAYLRWRLPLLMSSEGSNTFSQTPESEEKLVRLQEDGLEVVDVEREMVEARRLDRPSLEEVDLLLADLQPHDREAEVRSRHTLGAEDVLVEPDRRLHVVRVHRDVVEANRAHCGHLTERRAPYVPFTCPN